MGRKFEVRKASMAKTQGAKSKVYAKYGKEIYVVAKNGGVDPEGNLSLRRLIEKAKKDQVPAHVIEKAIDKAAGGGGEDFLPTRYEGFGPGGCMVIADCLTDNNNRTFGDVRVAFNKGKAKLGGQGTVAHMFDHQAVFVFPYDDEDEILETLMEADVDVTEVESEDGNITVYAPHTEFFKTKTALHEAYPDLVVEVEEITFIPQTYVELVGEDLEQFETFLEMLNDVEDVQEVYHNVEMPDE